MSSKKSRLPDPMSRVPLPPPPREGAVGDPGEGALRAGELVDARYRIEEVVGEGGVGRVYRALQVKLGRDVAVKVLLDPELADEVQRPRFEREAMALAALSHPNVVAVQDYGVWRGRPFIVMEMLRGQSLRTRLDAGPLPAAEALRIARELLRALAYTHSEGVVHRDLKPGNVFLQAFPTQAEHVKILDFGFAKFVENSGLAGGPVLTVAGKTMGTPAYVSPERLYGGRVDGRTDLYSVGILLFEMLSGHKPYDGSTSDILRAHLSQPVPRLEELCPGLRQSEELSAFFERALAKDVDDRFANAGVMLDALDALSGRCVWQADEAAEPTAGATADEATAVIEQRPGWLGGLAPLAERLPSRTQWRTAAAHALRAAGRGTHPLRRWTEKSYRICAPRLRRAAVTAGQVLMTAWARLRQGSGAKVSSAPLRLVADTHARSAAVSEQAAKERPSAESGVCGRSASDVDRSEPSARPMTARGEESTGSLVAP